MTGSSDEYWIGLSYLDEDETFVWTDGTKVTYDGWSPHGHIGGSGLCVKRIQGGKWVESHCVRWKMFICERIWVYTAAWWLSGLDPVHRCICLRLVLWFIITWHFVMFSCKKWSIQSLKFARASKFYSPMACIDVRVVLVQKYIPSLVWLFMQHVISWGPSQ